MKKIINLNPDDKYSKELEKRLEKVLKTDRFVVLGAPCIITAKGIIPPIMIDDEFFNKDNDKIILLDEKTLKNYKMAELKDVFSGTDNSNGLDKLELPYKVKEEKKNFFSSNEVSRTVMINKYGQILDYKINDKKNLKDMYIIKTSVLKGNLT